MKKFELIINQEIAPILLSDMRRPYYQTSPPTYIIKFKNGKERIISEENFKLLNDLMGTKLKPLDIFVPKKEVFKGCKKQR